MPRSQQSAQRPTSWGDARLVLSLCGAEVLNLTAFASFAALLPSFRLEWSLTNTAAGWISGIYFAGYTAAVPLLASLTDRIDPRRIYLVCSAVSALAAAAFSLLADGFWSALALRGLAGVGLAGTYMPGLKILSDRLAGGRQSRAFAFYTASFSIGAAFSFLVSGRLGSVHGWPTAFGAAAAGSIAALLLVAVIVRGRTVVPTRPPGEHPLDFRPVLGNRAAMTYILGYAAHMWELFGQRSWIVAFLVFSQSSQPDGGVLIGATVIAALVNLAGVPASILGNELADRFGRPRVLRAIMFASAAVACCIGFTARYPYPAVALLCLLYGALCFGDSAALTVGAVTAADPRYRGATMAVHSCLGFTCSFFGPLVFGVVLDAAGSETTGWGLAFGTLGLAVGAGALLITIAERRCILTGDIRS